MVLHARAEVRGREVGEEGANSDPGAAGRSYGSRWCRGAALRGSPSSRLPRWDVCHAVASRAGGKRPLDATCKRRVGDAAEALVRGVDLPCALGHPSQKEKLFAENSWWLVRDPAWYLASGISLQQPGGIRPLEAIQ